VAGHHLLAGQPDGPTGIAGIHVRFRHCPRVGPVNGQPQAIRPDGTRSRQPASGRRAAPSAPESTAGLCSLRDRGIHRPGHVDQLCGRPAQRHQRPRTSGRHDDDLRRGQVVLQQVLMIINNLL